MFAIPLETETFAVKKLKSAMCVALSTVILIGCTPTVKVEAPDKPIVINLNVKIEQEVRIKVEKGVEDLLSDNPDIF